MRPRSTSSSSLHIPTRADRPRVERPSGLKRGALRPRGRRCRRLRVADRTRTPADRPRGRPSLAASGRVCAAALERFARDAGYEPAIARWAVSAEHGREGSRAALLRLPDPPSALIAGSSQILPGVLEALRARPEVTIVTFDGDSLLESIDRPIGVIDRQSTEIGRGQPDCCSTASPGYRPSPLNPVAVPPPRTRGERGLPG